METHTGLGTRKTEGFTVDNLDTKGYTEATNTYEKVFITARRVLESLESHCMDNEPERLACCQALADELSAKGLIRRENTND